MFVPPALSAKDAVKEYEADTELLLQLAVAGTGDQLADNAYEEDREANA
jgi:hypothetical protein